MDISKTFVWSHTLKTAGPFKILWKSPKFLEVRQPVTTTKHSNLRGIRCLHQLKLSLDLHGNLPETGRLTRQKKKMPFRKFAASKMRRQPCQRGFSVRKNPASKHRRQKRMENHFSAVVEGPPFLLKHWQQNCQQKVGNSHDQCSARSKGPKNYRTIVVLQESSPCLSCLLIKGSPVQSYSRAPF